MPSTSLKTCYYPDPNYYLIDLKKSRAPSWKKWGHFYPHIPVATLLALPGSGVLVPLTYGALSKEFTNFWSVCAWIQLKWHGATNSTFWYIVLYAKVNHLLL